MTTNIIMPQMGESITEGTITTWFKKVGEWVEKDDSLLLISTDKVDAEVPSPVSGFLQRILFPEGETVEIDTVIAVVSDQKEDDQSVANPLPTASNAEPGQPAQSPSPQPVSASGMVTKTDVDELRRTRSSPLVRKMALEHQLNLIAIEGTGISGRVTKRDVENHLRNKPSSPRSETPPRRAPDQSKYAYKPAAGDKLEPFSPMRSQIADHMVISRDTSVHVTTVFEVDMTRVAKLRGANRKAYEAKGVKLSFMPFILKAVVEGIQQFPIINSAIVDRSIAYRPDINLGVAVAVDWGLLVPVIREAEDKSLMGLARSLGDLANKARERKLSPDDLQGGTFTVTNPGVFGSLFGTPIINQPQVAILCVGTITKRAVVLENDAIAVRQMMYLALSFDHRVIDGATADRFMKVVKDRLESFPENLI